MCNQECNTVQSEIYSVSQAKINQFAKVSGGMGRIHIDPKYAEKTIFNKPLVHGLYLLALIEKEARKHRMGNSNVNVTFLNPIMVDEKFKIQFTKKEIGFWEILIVTEELKAAVGSLNFNN